MKAGLKRAPLPLKYCDCTCGVWVYTGNPELCACLANILSAELRPKPQCLFFLGFETGSPTASQLALDSPTIAYSVLDRVSVNSVEMCSLPGVYSPTQHNKATLTARKQHPFHT